MKKKLVFKKRVATIDLDVAEIVFVKINKELIVIDKNKLQKLLKTLEEDER